jgi:hypothetical protein
MTGERLLDQNRTEILRLAAKSGASRLRDILEAIAALERHTPRNQAAFADDEPIQVWCLRHLQIIGEAAEDDQTRRVRSRRMCRGLRSLACELCSSMAISLSTPTSSGLPSRAMCQP